MLIVLIGFSSISPVLAANGWIVEEGDELVFDLTVWNKDEITVDGSFTLTIEEISSTEELIYSIDTDFEIDEADVDNELEVDNATTNDSVIVMFLVVLLYSEDSFNDFLDDQEFNIEGLNDLFDRIYGDNDSIIYSIEELEYGFTYSVEDTELEKSEYRKGQWDENGILQYWEWTFIEDEEKSGFLVEKKGFAIPSFPMEIFMAIFAISTLGIIIRSKKHK